MAAAYAAVLSLTHTIHHIQHHPRPPIYLHKQQIQSLTQNLAFLQNFLERYSALADLESRIASAAYAGEDLIESHIVDQREEGRPLKRRRHGESDGSVDLYPGLERVIQDMDFIKKEAIEMIKEKTGSQDHRQPHHKSSVRSVSSSQINSTMMGFDDVFNEVMDELIGQQSNLQIIPIVGMGGIGKTTLVKNIYADSLIVEYFDVLAWVTVSREYNRGRVFSQVLCHENGGGEDELGEMVYEKLWGRRYLIVMDDIWSIEAWNRVKPFFPNNNDGSKILMTTRLSNVAFELSGSHGFQMKFLDDNISWDLLCETVFGKEDCPIELENIGKKIAKNCRGLPLSIVVTGGLLKNSTMTLGCWEHTLENLSSLVNLENDEHCLQILRTSYQELPIHLKPCFVYMGIYPEDDEIHVSQLSKLWVAEGILKPIDVKSLEEVAEEYLKELIDRNLISVHQLRRTGKIKLCKIHDLLTDLCLREAKGMKFICILKQQDLNIPPAINIARCICIYKSMPGEFSPQFLQELDSVSLTRSFLLMKGSYESSSSLSFRLLRIYSRLDEYSGSSSGFESLEGIFQRANLRYFSTDLTYPQLSRFPSSWSLLWNLQTLRIFPQISFDPIIVPPEIWEMHQLRHVMVDGLSLPNPPPHGDEIILENLQTFSNIWNLECREEVVKRIPNIKVLKLDYFTAGVEEEKLPNFYLDNVGRLQKLEYLKVSHGQEKISNPKMFREMTFSLSLKKLTLYGTKLCWEDVTTKLGSLPLLQVLNLSRRSCVGSKWETVEGQFCSLKFLRIIQCFDLKYWETDNTHFPRLEHLGLHHLPKLELVPLCIGYIASLLSITLDVCSKSAVESVERIKEEQEDNGNEDLKVQIGKNLNVCI